MTSSTTQKLSSSTINYLSKFEYDGFSFYFYDSLIDIGHQWDDLCVNDAYFQSSYLRIIELSPSLGLKPYYCIGYDISGRPTFAFYYQLKSFDLDYSMAAAKISSVQRFFQKFIKFNFLINGNLLITGAYGFYQPKNQERIALSFVQEINNLVLDLVNKFSPNKPSSIMMKDFEGEAIDVKRSCVDFHQLQIQPTMTFEVDPSWTVFEDYLKAIKAKYRTRYNRARKKLNPIKKIEVDIDFLHTNEERIHQLYRNVKDGVNFNLFDLPSDYFSNIKKCFGHDLIVSAYLDGEQIVGFSTCLLNYDHLDAHFLGYDPTYNEKHQLYLNMLYDLVEMGIKSKVDRVNLSRTAIEIKSSVGATPKQMLVYFKNRKPLINGMIKPLFNYFKPKMDYNFRNPFKDE